MYSSTFTSEVITSRSSRSSRTSTEFTSELTSAVSSRKKFRMSGEESSGEVFTVSHDISDEGISLHRGERVVLLSTKGPDKDKRSYIEYEDSELGMDLDLEPTSILDTSLAKHKMAIRPKKKYERSKHRWNVQSLDDTSKQGWVPIVVLQPEEEPMEALPPDEIMFRKEAVISELVETEEEFCRDLMKVVERYLKPLDGPRVPRYVSDQKDNIFGNFREIAIFHNTVLLEGIKYYAKEPTGLGRAFLRMERDFDKHVTYCHEESMAQEFLNDNFNVREYFEDLASKLGDDKPLSEHLKLPVQRINDYQLLLKELIKYCDKLREDTTDLNKALELMLGIPHRAEDLKYINNIEGYHGDIHKLGRLLRHNWFKVKTKEGKQHDRYLFLFHARILVCKVRKVGDNRYVFVLKEIIRLPEVEVRDHKDDPRVFEVGPFTLTSHQDHTKEPWIAEIQHYAKNSLTLAEHAADDLRLQEEENKNLEPLKGIELKLYSNLESSSEEKPPEDMSYSASRRTSLSKRVEEIRSGSVEKVVMESRVESRVVEEIVEEIEDTTPRCIINNSLFIKTIEGVNVEPGGSAAFECEIAAKSVTWLKDNRPISDRLADRMTQMSCGKLHRLEILNVTESDAGVYTAFAQTADGVISTCTANLVVQPMTLEEKRAKNAPTFLVRLKDTELLENTYLRFMVKVKGEPLPEVQFYKDDELITYKNERIAISTENAEGPGYYEVIIPEVKMRDSGLFKCVATNKFGEATCEGRLTVVDDKNIFAGLDEEGVDPEFHWIKDGKPFDPEERFKVLFQDDEDSLALVFTHVKPEDAGLYTCVASTSSGKISCSAELTVQGNVNLLFREPEQPKIESKHIKTEANIGSSAMLETKITGYPKPDIKWMKGGEEIVMSDRFKLLYEDEETIALVIKNVTLNDRGEYHVIATNLSGVAEDTITLDVKAAPSFTQKLTDVRTISGKEIKLQVKVDANPPPMVAWYKDGKQILNSDHVKLIEEGDSYTLLIERCELSDVGSYSIVCKNNLSQISEFCKVEIEGAPVFTKNLIKRVETEEGDSLTFLVKVHGNPMPDVKWYHKGQQVQNDATHKLSNDSDTYTLTLNAIKREDGGEYCCKLSNIHGEAKDFGKVCVKSRPEFSKGLGNLIAQEGDTNVGFSVEVDSFPKGKVQWFHDGNEITGDRKDVAFSEGEDTFTMVLKDVSRDDRGKYSCKIINSYGENETSAELKVLCKPKFTKPLKNVTVNEGDTLTLRIEVDATPEAEVKWFKDGRELQSDAHIKITRDSHRLENYELQVTLVRAEDGGEYEVKAINEMGTTVTKSTVIVQTISSGENEIEQTVFQTIEHKEEPEDTVTVSLPQSQKEAVLETQIEQQVEKQLEIAKQEIQVTEEEGIPFENTTVFKQKIERHVAVETYATHTSEEGAYAEAHTVTYTIKKRSSDHSSVNVEVNMVKNFMQETQESSPWCLVEEIDDYPQIPKHGAIEEIINEVVSKPKYGRESSLREDGWYGEKFLMEQSEIDTSSARRSVVEEMLNSSSKNEIEYAENLTSSDDEAENGSSTPSLSGKENGIDNPSDLDEDVKETEELPKKEQEEKDFRRQSSIAQKELLRADSERQSEDIIPEPSRSKEYSTEKQDETSLASSEISSEVETSTKTKAEMSTPEENLLEQKPKRSELEENTTDGRQRSLDTEDKPISQESKPEEEDSPKQRKNSKLLERQISQTKNQSELDKDNAKQYDSESLEEKTSDDSTSRPIENKEDTPCSSQGEIKDDNGEEPTIKEPNKKEKYFATASQSVDEQTHFQREKDNPELKRMKSLDVSLGNSKTNIPQQFSVEENIPELLNIETGEVEKKLSPEETNEQPFETVRQKLERKYSKDRTQPQSAIIDDNVHLEPQQLQETTNETKIKKDTEKSDENNSKISKELATPRILKSDMKDAEIFETWEHSYEIQADGNPYPEAKWLKGDEEVKASERIKISDDNGIYKLEIKDAHLDDTGTYKLVVSNVLGEASDSAELKIVSAKDFRLPQIQKGLEDKKVPKNQTAALTVVLTADPIPEAIWQHNGHDISKEFIANCETRQIHHGLKECKFSLTIPSSQHADTGEYKFTARNKSGEVSSKARLDILLKPEITVFKDIIGVPYEDAQFVACMKSNPRANVIWRKDGNKLTAGDHYDIETDHENEVYKLKVKGILLEDGGLYTFSAVNEIGEASADAKLKIHMVEPEFTKGLEDIQVREYAQLDLKVRAQGIPKPEIQWTKDGLDLEISEGMTLDTRCEGNVSSHLNIPHFKEEYAGKYRVRAHSVAGHCDTTCLVKLAMLSPSFSKSLGRAMTVEEGEPLELRCKIEASPVAKIKWFKDGEELKESDHVKLTYTPDGSVKLRIEEATPADCGAYKLFVENSLGNDSSICAVAVNPSPRAPIIEKKLEDVSITEGEPLFLQAQVMGFPLPELKWYKDGLPIRPSKEVNFINSPGGLVGLSLENASNETAGQYTLTASNKLGEASSTAEVDVILKDRRPEFRSHLLPTTVVEGFPLKLSVKVGGNPPPQLTWTKNGTPIDIDGENIETVALPDGTHTLLIKKASPLDAGVYAVTAKNSAGQLTSEAKVDVAGGARDDMPLQAPGFAYELRDAWAEEGSSLAVTAPFCGNPLPEVTWFKEGKEISSNPRLTFTNDGLKVGLSITPCEMDDMGTYRCVLKNPLGEAESKTSITVKKIFHAPTFIQKLHDLDQIIGLDGKLVCRVSGNPRPDVLWFFNGKPITEGNRYTIKREGDVCMLYIKDCSPDEDGYYKCIASNRDGKDETECQFRAVDKIAPREKGEAPCFLKKIGDQELIAGLTGRFTACISGYPDPEVEWYRNNERLYPSERITIEKESTGLLRLSIAHVDPLVDAAKYKVRIYNDYGEDECEASFIFDSMGLGDRHSLGEQFKDFEEYKHKGAPMPLADRPIISRMSDRRLTLSWKPSIPYGPRDPVTYHVEMCEVPKGDWITARTGIRSCVCEIRNLEPFRDYKFRVRVENKYGLSDPSPYAITYRSKLEPEPPKFIPFLAPGIDFRPESSPYFPKDFDIERPPHDGYAQAPRFLRQEHYTQYGVKNHNSNLFWFVYGYPKPKMTYFFNDEPIEMGGRYDCSYTRNGQATLFINKMLERDVGTYEAVATNEHGEARQRVHLEIAEYPEFIKRPDEMTIVQRQSGRLEARVIGVPSPDIKWYKDWQPLAPTSRIKINRIDPDHCTLLITDAILKDSGLYSISASNVAGAISCSVMVHVEEKEEFPFQHYGRGHNVRIKTKPITDYYDFGDELGRGTQGVTYHVVERSTGRNYAAKVMHGRGELRSFMHNELEMMNILNSHKIIKIHDAYETMDGVTLVMELASGGELLDALTRQPYTSESEIASYIRQLLVALDYLHEQNIAHLGLTPGDLLVSHAGGDDLKLTDFGLARRIHPGQLEPLDFGMPEFVSPETIKGEGVDVSSDMWSVGVITHLLLTGISLFRGNNDMETLDKVKLGFWEFDEERMRNFSLEARDFITKLLVIDQHQRMDVKTALRHPWLNYADRLPPNLYEIPTEKIHNYFNLWKDWYGNASCRTWYRRRPLIGAYHHPSKMVYPPHYMATPTSSPERELKDKDWKPPSWVDDLPSRQPLNYDLGTITSESHYQNGPDTYLLQLRDVDFPVRIREYMKVAAHRHRALSPFSEDSHLDWRMPVIKERRRFTDIMDEEIDDERKDRIHQYGLNDSYTVRRLKHELGSRLDTHVEAEAIIEASRQGQAPFMREKPQITAIEEGKEAELSCYAVGDPKPSIQWFKNDMLMGSSNRVKIEEDEIGRSKLRFTPASSVDTGIYKVVARNRMGQTISRTRVILATIPDAPDSPQVSEVADTQILLKWKQPKHDGHSPVLYYTLQFKQQDGLDWKNIITKIEHEFYLVNGLKPATAYIFRLQAYNKIGSSDHGIPSEVIRTLEEGCDPITLPLSMKHAQALSELGQEQKHAPIELDYSIERNPVQLNKQSPGSKYTFISEVSRGRFSVIVKGIDKTNDRIVVAKLLECSETSRYKVDLEFEALRTLRHERIATLLEAFKPHDEPYCAFILEKLQGADVLTFLASRHEYNEQMVATIITQILDGLQYLHWRGYCHLDLQPDNIVMASIRSLQVKLVDFGCAQKVTKLGDVVKCNSAVEFTAPEVLCQEPAYPQSDIWSVGVLAYIMLSGVSPFLGENIGETRQNINFVRFRYEYLYKEITQEATRFIMLVFKRAPNKRPSVEECHEHRWLLPSEYMIKRRERAVFLGNRIKDYSEKYHQAKREESSTIAALTSLVTGPLERSNSIIDELITSEQ